MVKVLRRSVIYRSKKIRHKTKQNKMLKMKEEAKKISRSKRNEYKKLMMTIMSVKSEYRTHMNVGVVACVCLCVCLNLMLWLCCLICELMTFSLSLFFRGIFGCSSPIFRCKILQKTHNQRVNFFLSCTKHTLHSLLYTLTHAHTHAEISQSRNGFVFFSVDL